MSVLYKAVSKKPGLASPDSPTKYYPVLTGRRQTDIREVCKILSDSSTVTAGDIRGVLEGLIRLIPDLLMEGRTVKLDGFGTFRIHASAKGQDAPEKVTGRDVTSVKMSFLPDKEIKRELKHTKFVKQKK
jgi:predicted histone-like DNA-binding protein